jgi:diguanylate cyclase (GGDEF)-like protein/PAS domain S-box-containing protein
VSARRPAAALRALPAALRSARRRRRAAFRPFANRGRWTVPAVVATFALVSGVSSVIAVRMASGSQHRAAVVQIASRQRTLAERYVNEVLLRRAGEQADPARVAQVLRLSADALLRGGTAPAVDGDDDETLLAPAEDRYLRAQLREEQRLVVDLTRTGAAVLVGRTRVPPVTANERIRSRDPLVRLRVLAALTSNVSLDATRTIAAAADDHVTNLIAVQVGMGLAGVIVSLLLGLVLVAATRRQHAHFRALVTSSTDLVLVFGGGGCRYASSSVQQLLGCREPQLLGDGLEPFLHPDDIALVGHAAAGGSAATAHFRLRDRTGRYRQLEANVTDLRSHGDIRGIVLNARDVTERAELERELTRRAYHDELTGLANRSLFCEVVEQALAGGGDGAAVLLADLDGFKQVNDTLGHDAGDAVLQEVARRFDDAKGPRATVARLAGDEFAMLVPSGGAKAAVAAAQRLLASLAEPLPAGDREFAIGASIGVAPACDRAGGAELILRHADMAMYAAKASGRNRHVLFGHDIADAADERVRLIQGLRQAVARSELELHYQPEVDLASGRVVSAEALLRWHSPEHGGISPARFIPLAEESGAIFELGRMVIDDACRTTAEWLRRGIVPPGFTTWINVSGTQLSGGGVCALVSDALERFGLPAGALGLEVTETAIVSGGAAGERALVELHELSARGVRIAIDDFGTGFSSLGKLREFPVDLIKIDRSFIAGAATSPKDAAIVTSVVHLAHALGVQVLAEGIEDERQIAFLRAAGCQLGQGFLFARPAPADRLAQLLAGQAAAERPEAA